MSTTDRLRRPLIRENGRLVECDWDTAMNRVTERSRQLLQDRGPLSHGFYTSGQLFLEEYYALAVLGKGGIGTPHMDGNTRLCTATAAAALKESFGADGQPGTYTDIDSCDAIFLYGHNVAETQTVLWSRVLDRIAGQNRPRVVCVDPRDTEVARYADVHLAVRPGTNLALMNALVHDVLANGWLDEEYVEAHTLGLESLRAIVEPWTAEAAAAACDVSAADIREAARIFGTSSRILSTVLQGFYQSAQATAASCQVNNLHSLRGLLGRPGSGILQMNGQPTAQNNRECGADGDLPGFRNWENPAHIAQLAGLWDVDPLVIPHWAPPHACDADIPLRRTGIDRIPLDFGHEPGGVHARTPADTGHPGQTRALRCGSGPLPHRDGPNRRRRSSRSGWGEKTGTFTNVNRIVHLSDKAVEPPGEARSDLDIFLDYAAPDGLHHPGRRTPAGMGRPRGGFDAWQECYQRPAMRLHRDELWEAQRRQRHPLALQ